MNRISRYLRILSPTCAVLVAGAVTLGSTRAAQAKTPSFLLPTRSKAAPSPGDAFVRVGLFPTAPTSNARAMGGFMDLLGSTNPLPGGWHLAALDDSVNVSFSSVAVRVSEAGFSAVLQVVRTGDTTGVTSVNFASADGAAKVDKDYKAVSGTVVFARGQTTRTIVVPIIDDTDVEGDESFTVNLSTINSNPKPTNGTLTTGVPTTVTIDDNDSSVAFTSTTQTVGEGDGTADIIVVRQGGSPATTVKYTTTDVTAIAGSDYTGTTSGTLNIPAVPPGETTPQFVTLSIPINDDSLEEGPEDFTVTLSAPGTNTVLDKNITTTITIADNDNTAVGFASPTQPAVSESDGTASIDVVRSGDISRPLTVDFQTNNGSATAPADYGTTNGTLSFGANQRRRTISVPIVDDSIAENTENFSVRLSNPQVAGITPVLAPNATTTVSIVDNEAQVNFGSTAPTVPESGTALVFTVNRTVNTTAAASVDYTISNGTATNGQDFTGMSGTLSFAPDQKQQTISIPIAQDVLDEDNETFSITLTNPMGVLLGPNSVSTATIIDDDATPSLSIADATPQNEGNTASAVQPFTVTLSAVSGRDVTIPFTASDGTATAADKDYIPTTGTLVIPKGSPTGTINIPIVGDTKFEKDEAYIVTINSATNATIARNKATGQILNDDAAPASSFNFSAATTSVSEGVASGRAVLTVTRTGDLSSAASVAFATKDGSAFAGDDYSPLNGTLSFAAGETSKTISLQIFDDSLNEATESFSVALSNPQGFASLGATSTATVTITDDDPAPTLTLSSPRVIEGDSGTVNLVFTALLSGVSEQTVSVDYTTADGSATVADGDYLAQSGTLTFAPNDTSKTIVVVVNGDTNIEGDETLSLNLSNAQNVTLAAGSASATGTIANDDTPPTFSDFAFDSNSASVTVAEDAGKAILTVTRTTGADRTASIDFSTSDGTALAGQDYAATSGTLNFAVGQTSAQIVIPIIDDTLQEPGNPENLTVTLSNVGGNGVLPVQNTATVSITDNEGAPTLSIADTSVLEGNSGVTQMAYTVSLFPQSQSEVSVDVSTIAGGTASSASGRGKDFRDKKETLTFAPGQSTATFIVEVAGDPIVEPDETVLVQLSNPQGAPLNARLSKATGTIQNDDVPGAGGTISFLSGSYSINEGAGFVTITLGRSGNVGLAPKESATVRVKTGTGTATPNSDYRAVNKIVTFAAGATTTSFVIPIIDDTIFESDESVALSLSEPSDNAILGATTAATLIITDDDTRSTRPRVDSISPRDSVGSPFTVTAGYSSDLGAADLTSVLIQVGGTGGFQAVYNPKTNLLSLNPATGQSAAPGARVVLSNNLGSLDCSKTTVSRAGNTLRVTWTMRINSTVALPVYTGATGSSGETVFARRGSWRPAPSASGS